MTEPELPPFLTSDGVNLALMDAVVIMAMVLSRTSPNTKVAICEGLRARWTAHQTIAAEHATAPNVNAAATLRLIMMQLGCDNIPDHQ